MRPDALLDTFRRLARAIQARGRGACVSGAFAPDWAEPGMLQALSCSLPGGPGDNSPPLLNIALRDGIPGRALPRHWQPHAGGPVIALKALRAPRAIAQAAPRISPERVPGSFGTATALVRDLLAPERSYLLTCGHVMAADALARYQDAARIDATATSCVGHLAQWLPPIGAEVYRSGIDAALLELTPADAMALRADASFLPAQVGGALTRDLPVRLQRSNGPQPGQLKVYWSGYVDIPGVSPGYPDYFLTDAIGYRADGGTIGGDSGAAVWDTRDTLLGMHIGALPDAGVGEANAVLSPIQPVLDWFEVQAYTRHELPVMAAPVTVSPLVPPEDPHIDPADWQAAIVAQTLWGEARGEGEEGMHAVGSVILNRLNRGWRGAATAAEVCRAYKQFSCWNENDPNRRQLDRISREPDAPYHQAAQIARLVVARTLPDITLRATHYCVASLRPPWVEGQSPCVVIGRHAFYNDIR